LSCCTDSSLRPTTGQPEKTTKFCVHGTLQGAAKLLQNMNSVVDGFYIRKTTVPKAFFFIYFLILYTLLPKRHRLTFVLTFAYFRSMFSPGNISEKLRVASFDCEGETVVDLFAGIGYFTLPYLVSWKDAMKQCSSSDHGIKSGED
jgi:hypothetical protein